MARSLGPGLARDLRTALIAVVVTLLATATPSIAAKVKNADKVDGKHAVGAKAKPSKRAGKLVATNKQGYLPDNIIKKAGDAERLDGLDSSDYLRTTAVPGSIQSGYWSAWGGGTGSYLGDTVTLPTTLASRIPESRVTYVAPAAAATAECPGAGQVAAVGWACFYAQGSNNALPYPAYDPSVLGGTFAGIGRLGFGLYFDCMASTCWNYGTWSISAPAAGLARTSAPGRTTSAP